MKNMQVTQLGTDITVWLSTYRSDINVLTRANVVQLIEKAALNCNWAKTQEETDLGDVDFDNYGKELELIHADLMEQNPSLIAELAEFMTSVIAMTGWRKVSYN